ncbi:MAG: hypothetical protein RXR43_15515 [Sulfolobus sp.]
MDKACQYATKINDLVLDNKCHIRFKVKSKLHRDNGTWQLSDEPCRVLVFTIDNDKAILITDGEHAWLNKWDLLNEWENV